jgi:hypothetical protein
MHLASVTDICGGGSSNGERGKMNLIDLEPGTSFARAHAAFKTVNHSTFGHGKTEHFEPAIGAFFFRSIRF